MKKGITPQHEPAEYVTGQAPAYKAALYGAAGGEIAKMLDFDKHM